jgi:hypothetical protein
MQPTNREPGDPARASRGRLGWVVPTLSGLILIAGVALCVVTAVSAYGCTRADCPGIGVQSRGVLGVCGSQ